MMERDINLIKSGSLVEINNGIERFLVEIIYVNYDEYIGKVCNKCINRGDLVAFNRSNIIEIKSKI